jgi:hypothetical protein
MDNKDSDLIQFPTLIRSLKWALTGMMLRNFSRGLCQCRVAAFRVREVTANDNDVFCRTAPALGLSLFSAAGYW